MEVSRLGKLYELDAVWIGATDLGESRRWVWSKDGDDVKEFHWRAEEPSNTREQCIEVIIEEYPRNWNDIDCQTAKPFICEDVSLEERFPQVSHPRIPLRIDTGEVPIKFKEITEGVENPENVNGDRSEESPTDIEPIIHLRGPAKEIYSAEFATFIGDGSSDTHTTEIQLDPRQLTKIFQKVFALIMIHISAEGGLTRCHPDEVPEQPSSFGQAVCKLGLTVMKQIDMEEEPEADEEGSKALTDAINSMTEQLIKNVQPEVPVIPEVTVKPDDGPSSGLKKLYEKYTKSVGSLLSQYKINYKDEDENEDSGDAEDEDDFDEEKTLPSDVYRAIG